jgi:flagellar biosynthesis/type III secretory pathway chaperone
MVPGSDDDKLLARQKQFLDQLEKTIRAANREIIHRHIPKLTVDDVTKMAIAVAELRARYLDAAKRLTEREQGVAPDAADVNRLAKARETYDEMLHAFEALRRAIERGYVDVSAKA